LHACDHVSPHREARGQATATPPTSMMTSLCLMYTPAKSVLAETLPHRARCDAFRRPDFCPALRTALDNLKGSQRANLVRSTARLAPYTGNFPGAFVRTSITPSRTYWTANAAKTMQNKPPTTLIPAPPRTT